MTPRQLVVVPPTSQRYKRGRRKLGKWCLFTMGLLGATVAADWLTMTLAGKVPSLEQLVGEGELYIVSVGLLMGALADLAFDCFLERRAEPYHISAMAFCMLLLFIFAVAYGAMKAQGREDLTPQPDANSVVAVSAESGNVGFSVAALVMAFVISVVTIWLSEMGDTDGTR